MSFPDKTSVADDHRKSETNKPGRRASSYDEVVITDRGEVQHEATEPAPRSHHPLSGELARAPIDAGKKITVPDDFGLSNRANVPSNYGRLVGKIDVVELLNSDDDNQHSQIDRSSPLAGAGDATNLDDDSDTEVHRQEVEDIGGQFAHRSVSPKDWKSLGRMFHCREDIEEHRHVGFKIIISGYQLHAIW
ncbi:hypothetical protein DL770_000569 [Monosporascus sp. CRB-9-2]|nr:hypothetical protein DL770_000569 [Monosporascus sp. CRB-9-2]